MRASSILVTVAILFVALFAGPAHEIFAADDHIESSACKDRLAGPHFDDCNHDPDCGPCVFCVHPSGNTAPSGATLLLDLPTVAAFDSAVASPSFTSLGISLPDSRAPPSVIAA